MFELKHHPVRIAHINVRTEKHGEEDVKALDVKITFEVTSTRLDELAEGLRNSLYEPTNDPDLVPDDSHPTEPRFTQMGAVPWGKKLENVGFHLHLGNGCGKGDVQFPDAKFSEFFFRSKAEGIVTCKARLQLLPSSDQAGKIIDMLKREVPASLDVSQATGEPDEADDDE